MVSMLCFAGKLSVSCTKCFLKWLFLCVWCAFVCLYVGVRVCSHMLVHLETRGCSEVSFSLRSLFWLERLALEAWRSSCLGHILFRPWDDRGLLMVLSFPLVSGIRTHAHACTVSILLRSPQSPLFDLSSLIFKDALWKLYQNLPRTVQIKFYSECKCKLKLGAKLRLQYFFQIWRKKFSWN